MTELPKRATLIVNTRSRSGQRAFEEAKRRLSEGNFTLEGAIAVKDPKKLEREVRRAVHDGTPMLIVGGGDGSLSTAVDHLVGTKTVFALLPLGTANSFARSCGIALDLPGAIDVILNGRAREIDLGVLDDDYFANFAAIGLSPLIAATIPHWLKGLFGRAGYALWVVVSLARFKPFILRVNGEEMEATEVRIANGSFQGGTQLVEDAHPRSGDIIVQAVLGKTRLGLARSWIATLLGRPKHLRNTREFRGHELRIETIPPLPISIDGEVCARTPTTAKVACNAILMALPV